MNGKITVVELVSFVVYIVFVVIAIRLVGQHSSQAVDLTAALIGICSWPYMRPRVFAWLSHVIRRKTPTDSVDRK